ncbi:MAG: 4-hydroxy-tetrahydrodipicolinate synthase [Alphaproteobacteria bacterium]|nr:4-hydroxy-tetrahydrodipicolinate synthase [Alphaproteobacteria bacterium]
MFQGSFVALVTPFKNGAVDESAFEKLVEWQISEGTDGLVPCGTTGESPTLSHEEHRRVVEICIKVANGRRPVVAGTGSNSTEEAIALTQHAKKAGANAALIVTPYYNKPTQEGMYQHFKAIHDAADLPIIVYNIPPRSVVDMSVETMARLAKLPNIVGVKDATMDLTRPMKTRMAIGPKFCMMSGEDSTAVNFLAGGGDGCISVAANVAPRMCAEVQKLWRANKAHEAVALQQRLMPLHLDLFCETNPAPAKYALSLLGKCQPDVRLPLVQLADASREKVRRAMQAAGLIN